MDRRPYRVEVDGGQGRRYVGGVDEPIAFYGTLMSGLAARPGRPELSPHVRLVGDCLLPGRLLDVGPYPALVQGEGVVRAELWRTTSERAFDLLDEWEAYHPQEEAASAYVRRRVELLDQGGTAWVYLWNGPGEGLPAIAGGDWRAHLGSSAGQPADVPKRCCASGAA